jgi:hypothetical protein
MNGIFLNGASGIEYFYTPYFVVETRWHPGSAGRLHCLKQGG